MSSDDRNFVHEDENWRQRLRCAAAGAPPPRAQAPPPSGPAGEGRSPSPGGEAWLGAGQRRGGGPARCARRRGRAGAGARFPGPPRRPPAGAPTPAAGDPDG